MTLKSVVAATAALLLPATVQAAQFVNGSFESGTFVDNTNASTDDLTVGSTAITGWVVVGTGDVAWEKAPAYNVVPSDGQYSLDLTGYRDAAPYGGMQQTFDTIAGHSYTVTFDVGSNTTYTNATTGATVQAYINGIAAGAPVNNNDRSALQTWKTGSFGFTTAAGTTSTQLQLLGLTGGAYIGLDNVTLTDATPTTLPEPVTWAAMTIGLGAVGFAMRRRRRSDASLGLA